MNKSASTMHTSRALRRLACLILLACAPIGALAATYYIDPTNGDNANTGLSSQAAWKTFRNIFTYRGDRRPSYYRELAAGDTVYVMDGTISEIHRPGDDKGSADVTGSPALMRIDGDDLGPLGGAPLRILAYPGHHPVLDANYQGNGIELEHANSVEIAGLAIRRAYGCGIGADGCTGISIHACEIYDGSGVDNNNTSGLYLGGSTSVDVYDCILHDNYDRDAIDSNPVGISTWNSTNMVLFSCAGSIEVHDCLIYQTPVPNSTTNSGGGIKYKHSTASPTSTFEVYRNVFRNCKFFAFQSGSANTHFHHNIIIGGNTAISTEDCGGLTHQVNQVFEYNTIYRPFTEGNPSVSAPAFSYYPTTTWRNADFPNDPQRVIFRYNIVSAAGTYSTENAPITVYPYINDTLYAAAIPELFVDHNAYLSSSGTSFRASIAASTGYGGPLYGGYYDWTQWRALTWTDPAASTAVALGFDANSLLADPQFAAVDLNLARYDSSSNAFRPTNSAVVTMGAYATTTADTTAPSRPTSLRSTTVTAATVSLTWSASIDNVGVTGYRIYRDGAIVGTAISTTYTDTGLTTGTSYSYTAVAFDAAGNVSGFSAAATAIPHDETYTAFADWVAGHFTAAEQANAAISGLDADPDGCGLTNLARYAFGLPARGPNAAPVTVSIVPASGQNYLTVTFPRKGYAPDLEYVVQASSDLVTWTDLQTVLPGYPKTFTVTDLVATSAAPRRFLRMRVDNVIPIDDPPGH